MRCEQNVADGGIRAVSGVLLILKRPMAKR